MSEIKHERPGVYSAYDASAVVYAGRAPKRIGLAAKASRGLVCSPVALTSYAGGVATFGETEGGMSELLRVLFQNGASVVVAVRVANDATLSDYQAAFSVLEKQNAQVVVCDSADLSVQQALRTSLENASAIRRERIAVVGGYGESAAELVTHAAALNSERMVLVGPDILDSTGKTLPGMFAAAAVAGGDAGDLGLIDPILHTRGNDLVPAEAVILVGVELAVVIEVGVADAHRFVLVDVPQHQIVAASGKETGMLQRDNDFSGFQCLIGFFPSFGASGGVETKIHGRFIEQCPACTFFGTVLAECGCHFFN